jgi:uncharacterized protein (UPF0332 family)
MATIEIPSFVGYNRSSGVSIVIQKNYEEYFTIDDLDSRYVHNVFECQKCGYVHVQVIDKEKIIHS